MANYVCIDCDCASNGPYFFYYFGRYLTNKCFNIVFQCVNWSELVCIEVAAVLWIVCWLIIGKTRVQAPGQTSKQIQKLFFQQFLLSGFLAKTLGVNKIAMKSRLLFSFFTLLFFILLKFDDLMLEINRDSCWAQIYLQKHVIYKKSLNLQGCVIYLFLLTIFLDDFN